MVIRLDEIRQALTEQPLLRGGFFGTDKNGQPTRCAMGALFEWVCPDARHAWEHGQLDVWGRTECAMHDHFGLPRNISGFVMQINDMALRHEDRLDALMLFFVLLRDGASVGTSHTLITNALLAAARGIHPTFWDALSPHVTEETRRAATAACA